MSWLSSEFSTELGLQVALAAVFRGGDCGRPAAPLRCACTSGGYARSSRTTTAAAATMASLPDGPPRRQD